MTSTDLLALVVVFGEWTGLARGLIGAPIYAGLLDIVALGVLALTLIRRFQSGRRPISSPLPVLVFAFFVLALVEILNPNVPSLGAGLEGFRKTAFTTVAFFIVYLAKDGDPSRFFRIIAVGSIPALLMAIRQFAWPWGVELSIVGTSGISPITFHSGVILRAFSPTAGPFHLGILCVCVTVIALAQARLRSQRWIALAALSALTLGLTLTRANMAALGVAMFAMIIASPIGGRLRSVLQASPSGVAMVLAVLLGIGAVRLPYNIGSLPDAGGALPATTAPLPSPVNDSPTVGDVVGGVLDPVDDRNLRFRFAYWQNYIAAIAAQPLTGYGTSSAADGFDRYYAGTTSKNFAPHSLFFKAALEMGVLGLALLLGVLASALVAGFSLVRRAPTVGLACLGIVMAIGVSGITGPMLDAYPVNLLFWATCGWLARDGGLVSLRRSNWGPRSSA